MDTEVIVNLLHTVGHKNRVAHIVPFHDCHIAMAHEYDITRHKFESMESHFDNIDVVLQLELDHSSPLAGIYDIVHSELYPY